MTSKIKYEALNVEKSLSDKQSLLSKYQTQIVASREEFIGPKRIYLLFQVLDEISDHLGVFKELFVQLKSEIIETVFSPDISTGITDDVKEIKRIPYITQVQRMTREKEHKYEDYEAKISVLEESLFGKQKQYESLLIKFDNSAAELAEKNENINNLQEYIATLNEERSLAEREFNNYKETVENEIHNLKMDYQEVRDELHMTMQERDSYKPFKDGYDRMQANFRDFSAFISEDKAIPTHISQREKIVSDIKSSMKLQDQLFKTQNLIIQDFDKFLEVHKAAISMTDEENSIDAISVISDIPVRHFEAEKADHQLISNQNRFEENIDDLNNELALLQKHQGMLEEQLLGMTQEDSGRSDIIELLKGISNAGGQSVEDEIYVPGDPFSVNERPFSKYSLMLYVSTNKGKSFTEFQDAQYCHSCFEKTVVCPHKLKGRETVITLPANSTHLKLLRPEVKINKELLKKTLEQLSIQRPKRSSFAESRTLKSSSEYSVQTMTSDGEAQLQAEEVDSRFQYPFRKVWEDYHARTDTVRYHGNSMNKQQMDSLIEQFYATCLWDDEYTPEDEEGYSTLDNFYEFLFSRYLKEDIVFLVAHDFLTALPKYFDGDHHLKILSHVFINNLDGCVFRYFLVLVDLVSQTDWFHAEDFRVFLQLVYPFMVDEDIETLQIGFVSFCENKVSKRAVYDYCLYILLKYRDPMILEMESKCLQSPMKDFGNMTEREYQAVAATVISDSFDHLSKRLFLEAQAASERDGSTPGFVPVAKLSQILAYLCLLQLAPDVREELPRQIRKNRELQGIVVGELRDPKFEVKWTHTRMLNLAKAMAKSEQFRQAQKMTILDY